MTKKHLTDLQCKSTVYLTPSKILDPVRLYLGGRIALDPATEPNNPTNASFFCCKEPPSALVQLADGGAVDGGICLGEDGLAIQWSKYDNVFINPPYGKEIRLWCRRIEEEAAQGAEILALLPAGPRFATRYFQDHIFTPYLNVTCFVKGRVKFLRPDGSPTTGSNPYDSMVMGFNVDVDQFAAAFGHLGAVVKMSVM